MIHNLFSLSMSPWELILRGTLIYWFLFLLLRFILHRDAGSVGLADILVIVLIADAAQNGMAGEYKSVTEAMILIGTIAAWNYWIDWMSYRYEWFSRFAERQAVPLIRHGVILRANMRREMITDEELQTQFRENGIENASEVKRAMVEPDGKISFVRYSDSSSAHPGKKLPGAA